MVLVARGLDVPNSFKDVPKFIKNVPNFLKDVPNFLKDIPNFLKDVPRVPKSIMGGEQPPITSYGSPKEQIDIGKGDRGLVNPRIRCTKLS